MFVKKIKHKPYSDFKGMLVAKGLTYEEVAKELGISFPTLSKKISGASDFYLSEVNKLKDKFDIPCSIFLG